MAKAILNFHFDDLIFSLRYNSSLFAYGQTGSGKSWSVFGYGINKGIFAEVSVGKYMIIILKCELNLWNDAMVNFLPNSNESQASCRCLRSSCSKRSRQRKVRAGSSLRSSSACWRSTTRYNSCVKFIRILILTKKYDDSIESLMWWKGGKWSSCHHRSWKEETAVEDSTGSEKRILRWVTYLQSFMAYLKKFITLISLFQRTAWKRCSWTTMMKSTHAWKRGR